MADPATDPAGAAPLEIALVIPVRDDAERLGRLLAQARGTGRFAQIVVVDDGSDPPLEAAGDVTLIRHERSLGGGVARNRGLGAVATPYLVFFDSDDLFLPGELGALLDDLAEAAAAEPFDLCLFKYADSRVAAAHGRGQPDWDERFWTAAGLGHRALSVVPPAARPIIARTANYPWNKVYRTAFLRDNGIACAETAVHQDIPLHWLALMRAKRMFASDRLCAWHEVRPGGGRVSDRRGAERLQVFDALSPVARLAETAGPEWRHALTDFVPGLCDWIRARLDPVHHAAFDAAERDFLGRTGTRWRDEIATADPALAERIAARSGTGGETAR